LKVLVTGCAGFLGFFLARRLLEQGEEVFGVDDLNTYYPPKWKEARIKQLLSFPGFRFWRFDLADGKALGRLFAEQGPFDGVVHMAAQAGVRYSLQDPLRYAQSNLVAFAHLLENWRQSGSGHLLYASSSSVYGNTATDQPLSVDLPADRPLSFYAATKRANELMAHAYSHLYNLPSTGVRYFTVYGPWGRPDMAYFSFTRALFRGEPIQLFSEGRALRDFTFVEDAVEATLRLFYSPPATSLLSAAGGSSKERTSVPYRVVNVGSGRPVSVLTLVQTLEKLIGQKAKLCHCPPAPGDMAATWADIEGLAKLTGFRPRISLEEGLKAFVEWYQREGALLDAA
jgi:UDP-glucuronate 4-epimerase